MYEKNKAQINIAPDAFDIRAAKEAYKNISNVSSLFQQISGLISYYLRYVFKPCICFFAVAWLQKEVWGHQE